MHLSERTQQPSHRRNGTLFYFILYISIFFTHNLERLPSGFHMPSVELILEISFIAVIFFACNVPFSFELLISRSPFNKRIQ